MQVESGAAKDELKRLRKEMLRLKNEWTTLKALYESAKVCKLYLGMSPGTLLSSMIDMYVFLSAGDVLLHVDAPLAVTVLLLALTELLMQLPM